MVEVLPALANKKKKKSFSASLVSIRQVLFSSW